MSGLKTERFNRQKKPAKQSGAALVVALVVLAVVTVIGVSNIQSTTLEMRMAASLIDRAKAFALVEAALIYAEGELEGGGLVTIDALYDDCSLAAGCFNSDCDGGFCADVDYPSTSDRYSCTVAPNSASTPRTIYWKRTDIWEDDSLHHQTPETAEFPVPIKYIYEFLCYIDTSSGTPDEGKPLFRITAFLDAGVSEHHEDSDIPWRSRSPVMLQSTYALPW
jgi:type IV pilus assembly protein PilX